MDRDPSTGRHTPLLSEKQTNLPVTWHAVYTTSILYVCPTLHDTSTEGRPPWCPRVFDYGQLSATTHDQIASTFDTSVLSSSIVRFCIITQMKPNPTGSALFLTPEAPRISSYDHVIEVDFESAPRQIGIGFRKAASCQVANFHQYLYNSVLAAYLCCLVTEVHSQNPSAGCDIFAECGRL